MKKITILFSLIIVCLHTFSQVEISSELLNEIGKNNSGYLNINIYFKNFVEIENVDKELNVEKGTFDRRVKTVTDYSKNNSEISVKNFYKLLDNFNELKKSIKNEKVFWVLNMLNADVKAEYIENLLRFDGVKYIDINSPRYRLLDVAKPVVPQAKVVNGAEESLYRINADKLWAMGYTGRNILFLSLDTGVEVEHPAIANNYAGKYLPQSQCWLGIRHENPTDNSTHGTHTTGTVLGLDHTTNDTIGVAFNARFIATDPIASTASELLTPAQLLSVFQWALDPDGNPNTTSDVPRVINNSWGFAASDITAVGGFDPCNLPETEVLITIEAAGIASPFSAGNEGESGISTIGFPALRVFNEVNPMSVGALNTDNSIAYFSSLGPTQCVSEEGPLKIKPEISAPGINIRSCVPNNMYGYYQGTSMACPHVTGALLLLAEAFPNVSAYELKYALYQTAIDLGETGEDNTYGMGLIDVYAAFNYLTQTYTPKPPIENNYDIVTEILSPNTALICNDGSPIHTYTSITNLGTQSITNFYAKVFVNDIFVDSITINNTLNSNQQLILPINFDATLFSAGKNKILIIVKAFENIEEYDIYNNGFTYNFSLVKNNDFPFVENFETINDINDLNWLITNADRSNTWQILPWGENDEHKAIGVIFKGYNNYYAEDFLLLPKISLPNENNLFLYFKYAYKNFLAGSKNDSLFISISTDCGQTFTELFKNGGESFGTVPQTGSYAFFKPTSINDFSDILIDISDYKNQNILILLKSKNDLGSVMYIDSLAICKLGTVSISDNMENKINIYPSPTNDFVKIKADIKDDVLEIYDISGKLVKRVEFNNEININCTDFAGGIYTIYFIKNNVRSKFIKQ